MFQTVRAYFEAPGVVLPLPDRPGGLFVSFNNDRGWREEFLEEFLPPPLRELAYEDTPLPIAEGQMISQPYIVALIYSVERIGQLAERAAAPLTELRYDNVHVP
jgi:Protein-L-isoaspartate(D-aspartate) O-methyltransferase (PCMT)